MRNVILIENKLDRAKHYDIPEKLYKDAYLRFQDFRERENDVLCPEYFIDNNIVCIHKSILIQDEINKIKINAKNCLVILYTGNSQVDSFDENFCELKDTTFYNLLKFSIEQEVCLSKIIENKIEENINFVEEEKKYIDSNIEKIDDFFSKIQDSTLLINNDFLDFDLNESIEKRTYTYEKNEDPIDKTLFNELDDLTKDNSYKRIVVCLNLSVWYANEYIGLRVIHLLRLKFKELNISQDLPIYLISHLTEFELLKRTELANILLTENVFRLDFEKDIYYYENNLKNNIEVEKSLKENLKITPPTNIENYHSRENLYSIDEWKKSLGIENDNVYDLYYVLETYKNPIKLKDISKIIDKYKQEFKNPIEGKVLVIENELEKGWKEIYDKLFEDSKVEIDYLFTDENKLFKPNSIDQIKELLKIKIEKFRPNFILLDFRLMESDYDAQDIEKISGFEVLKEIKNINFGIHVFLTSVSSQAKYLDRLYNVGLNGYIQKRFGSVKTPIEKLYDCLKIYQRIRESSKYYYDFEETFRVIEHNSNNPNKSDIQHLKSFMSYTRLSLRSLIYLNNKGGIDSNSFNIETAFVFAFIALESLTHYKYDKIDYDKRVFIEEKDCKIKKMSQYEELIDNSGNLKEPPSNQKIRNIIYLLDEIYYEDSKEGQEYRKEKEMLFKKRNNLIHNLGRNYIGEITMDDLSYLYQIICLSKNLINSTN